MHDHHSLASAGSAHTHTHTQRARSAGGLPPVRVYLARSPMHSPALSSHTHTHTPTPRTLPIDLHSGNRPTTPCSFIRNAPAAHLLHAIRDTQGLSPSAFHHEHGHYCPRGRGRRGSAWRLAGFQGRVVRAAPAQRGARLLRGRPRGRPHARGEACIAVARGGGAGDAREGAGTTCPHIFPGRLRQLRPHSVPPVHRRSWSVRSTSSSARARARSTAGCCGCPS